jgi:hypothetical protein
LVTVPVAAVALLVVLEFARRAALAASPAASTLAAASSSIPSIAFVYTVNNCVDDVSKSVKRMVVPRTRP